MSTQRTPTYDKSHYSWQPPSSQASQSLISDKQGSGGPGGAGGDPVTPDVSSYFHLPRQPTDAQEEGELDSKPGLPRRSTFNYKNSSEEYKKQLEDGAVDDQGGEEFVHGRRGSITSKPFKPSSKRTKSFDYRDKRGEIQKSMIEDNQPSAGFSET